MSAGEWRDVIVPGVGTRRAWLPAEDPGGESEYMPLSRAAELLGKSFRGVEVMIAQGLLRADVPTGNTKRRVLTESVRIYLERHGREAMDDEEAAIDEWRRTGRASQATLRMIERRQAAENSHWGIEARQPATPADNGVDPLAAYQARYAPERK